MIGEETETRIVAALKKMRERFPNNPPNPYQFAELCKVDPEELGIPSVEHAWMEAQKNANQSGVRWSHQSVHEAAKRAGAYDIARATTFTEQKAMKSKFEAEYRSIVKAMASGTLMLESDRDHNHDKFIERKMIESGEKQLAELLKENGIDQADYMGLTGRDALDKIKDILGRKE